MCRSVRGSVARDGEQRVDGGLQAVDLGDRGGQLGGFGVLELEAFEFDAQRGERRAELVRGVGAEGALAREQVVEALRGGVERDGDGVELGDRGAVRADGELPVAEAAGVDGEPLERPGEAAREHECGERGGRDDAGAERGEQQPGVVGVVGDFGIGAGGAHGSGDAFVEHERHGGQELAAAGARLGSAAGQGGARERVGACGAAAGDAPAGAVIDGEPVAAGRHFDGVAGGAAEIDFAGGGDGVALQAQQLAVAVGLGEHERERHGEQHHGGTRDAGDGEDESAPHGGSSDSKR